MSIRERMEEAMDQTASSLRPKSGWKDGTQFKDLGMDSLDVTEMVMEIEEEFNVSISEAEAEDMMMSGTVKDLEELVEGKI